MKATEDIFRAYDIRGVYGEELDAEIGERVGLAFGNFLRKQYNVGKNTKLFVDKLQEKEGSKITFDNVLMVDNGSNTKIGNPVVAGASVEAKIVKHFKDKKVIVFKKKRRKGYKVKNGHRQQMTEIIIEKVNEKSASKPKAASKPDEEKPKTKAKKTTSKTKK